MIATILITAMITFIVTFIGVQKLVIRSMTRPEFFSLSLQKAKRQLVSTHTTTEIEQICKNIEAFTSELRNEINKLGKR